MGKIAKERSLYFCFPYREVGGVSVLFLRMALALSKIIENDVFIVDYVDGYMAKHNPDLRVKLLEYKDDQRVIIPENAILILQSMTPWSIFPSLSIDDNAHVFFWNCYPYNLVPTLPGIRKAIYSSTSLARFILNTLLFSYKLKMCTFLGALQNAKGIAFMDRTNIEVTEYCLEVEIKNRNLLPVPIDHCALEIDHSKRDLNNYVRVAWIGRIADFKVHILKYAIQKMSQWSLEHRKKCIFFVVGTGEFLDFLKSSIENHEFFQVQLLGNMKTDELKTFLRNECDLLFAMGTSALEGASLGVPTVLLDIAYSEIKQDYLFKFLFNETGCVLGDVLTEKSFQAGNKSLEVIMNSLEKDFISISSQSYEYCRKYHSMESVTDKLIDCLSGNELTFSKLKKTGVLSPSFTYRIFREIRRKLSKK